MDLVTLPYVKERMGISQSTSTYDSTLRNLISAVSSAAESFLNRTVKSGTYTEYFDVEKGTDRFCLRAYPISSVTGVWNDADWVFGSDTAVGTDYYKEDANAGVLYVNSYVLITGFQVLKVTYVGGLASTTADILYEAPDIANAITKQVVYEYNTRQQSGATGASASTGNVTWTGGVVLLDEVKEALKQHRSVTVVV